MKWIILFFMISCVTMTPRPVPDGYKTRTLIHWDCSFSPHTPEPEVPWISYIDQGGWNCLAGPPPEECLCGDKLCMCEEKPAEEPADETAEAEKPDEPVEMTSTGDGSPNISGNEGDITITVDGEIKEQEGDTFYLHSEDDPESKHVELTKEEHDLFLKENICPVCKREKKKSTVWCDGGGMTTAMYCGPGHYDENGKYHSAPLCNSFTYGCHCSNKHIWGMAVPSG